MSAWDFIRPAMAVVAVLACQAQAADTTHTLEIVDRVAKFQTFYSGATAATLDPDARFTLWQKGYGIAAVPPGPDGTAMARTLLDGAWANYPALLPKLSALQMQAQAYAREAFDRINRLYGTKDVAIHSRVVLYVGQFDNNAYSVPAMDGKPPTVMMPVENAQLRTVLAHEISHTIHFQLAGVQNSFGGPIGELLFLEGLAMRTAQKIVPGLPDTAYTQMADDHDWLAQCLAKKDAVLAGILPDLDKSGRDVAMKYTFGQGNNGMRREGYCAAWIVMGKMLDSGKTFAELARVPEPQMVATIRDATTAK